MPLLKWSFFIFIAFTTHRATFTTAHTIASPIMCQLHDKLDFIFKDGDYILIGIIPLSYVGYQTAHLMVAESIVYAVEEANKRLLPNGSSIGYYIYDSKDPYLFETLTEILLKVALGDSRMFESSSIPQNSCYCPTSFSQTDKIIGVIGAETSHSTAFISSMISFTQFPIVSYWATSIEFNDRELYPRVFRTISDNGQLAMVLVKVLQELDIQLVSILSSDEQYGRSGRQQLLKYLKEANICVDLDVLIELPMTEKFSSDIIRNMMKRDELLSVAQTFIIFAWSDVAQDLLIAASSLKYYNATWLLSTFDSLENGESIDSKVLDGTITAVADSGVYKDFYDHFWGHLSSDLPHVLPGWTHKYQDQMGIETVINMASDMTTLFYLPGYVRNAVFAFASATATFIDENNCTSSSCNLNLYSFVENYLKVTSFPGIDDENNITFNANGALKDPHFRVYDIFRDPEKTITFKEVAKTVAGKLVYLDNKTHWVNERLKVYPSKCTKDCAAGEQPHMDIGPLCCWICRKCKEGDIKGNVGLNQCTRCPSNYSNEERTDCLYFQKVIFSDFSIIHNTFLVIASSGVLLCAVATLIILNHRSKPYVRAIDIRYSLFQIQTQTVLFLVAIYVVSTETSVLTCHVQYFILAPLFTMVFSFLLAKSERLISVFKAKIRLSRRDILINTSKTYMLIFITVVLDVLITYVIYMHLESDIVHTDYTPQTLQKDVYCIGRDIIYCKSIYIALILIISGVQAFRSRKLPSRYNETYSLMSVIVTSFLGMFVFGFAVRFTILSYTKYALLLNFGFVISNVCILLLTYYVKFFRHFRRRKMRESRMKGGVNHRGINFEMYLKNYKPKLRQRLSPRKTNKRQEIRPVYRMKADM